MNISKNMKYLYVLTSDNSDCYLEQALLSMTSLRLWTPEAFISLLTDNITEATLIEKRSEIRNCVNELISVEIDDCFDKKARSRWLKTSMRHHIKGDFLYIDCDTIIVEDLSPLNNSGGISNLGAIFDLHKCLSDAKKYPTSFSKTKRKLEKLEFTPIENLSAYFNSGVLLCKDCSTVHIFFKEWHKLWLFCYQKGVATDQQSLNQANYNLGNLITELDGKWNYQIKAHGGLKFLHAAKIIHYYKSGDKTYLLANPNIFKKIKETGLINQELKSMLAEPKSLFSDDAKIVCESNEDIAFRKSKIYKIAKHIYHSKFVKIVINYKEKRTK